MEAKITKKAAKAAAIEARKIVAFSKRVRSLLGHVRITDLNLGVAYHAGLTAEDYAAQIASREPVGKVVHPLKVDAVNAAEKKAREHIERMRAKLEAAGWDLNLVAPRADSFRMSRENYKAAAAKRSMYYAIVREVRTGRVLAGGNTYIVAIEPGQCERLVQQWRKGAAQQYDAFICKLVAKVGPCDSATLEGSHVWANSVLTVTKGDKTERWYTQQIENRSVLGLYFPQWPTRLMGGR